MNHSADMLRIIKLCEIHACCGWEEAGGIGLLARGSEIGLLVEGWGIVSERLGWVGLLNRGWGIGLVDYKVRGYT